MKKVVITIYGKDYRDLADGAGHVARQLGMKTPSENTSWEDDSGIVCGRCDYTVQEDVTAEYQAEYGDDEN